MEISFVITVIYYIYYIYILLCGNELVAVVFTLLTQSATLQLQILTLSYNDLKGSKLTFMLCVVIRGSVHSD